MDIKVREPSLPALLFLVCITHSLPSGLREVRVCETLEALFSNDLCFEVPVIQIHRNRAFHVLLGSAGSQLIINTGQVSDSNFSIKSIAATSLVPRLRMRCFWYCRCFVEHSDFRTVLNLCHTICIRHRLLF